MNTNLYGPDVYIRPLTISDAKGLLLNTQDEEIRYLTGTKKVFTLEDIQEHICRWEKDPTRYDFAICLNQTKEMIGELSILEIDEETRCAGFRITMLGIRATGKGHGTQAIGLVLAFVFETLGLNRLQLEVYSHNPRAQRAYEKAGFIKEGVLREAVYINGAYSDEIIMAVLKSDYEKTLLNNKEGR